MAPTNTRRNDISTHELPLALYTQPSGRTPPYHTGSISRYCPTAPHPPGIPSNSQTFPILPEQLEKRLKQVQQRLTNHIPTQASPTSGSSPSPSPGRTLFLNPPPGMIPTVYAFHASTLGMPSMAEYLRFFVRYLDEMTPNKRGKALVDSELLRRIKLILTLQREGFSGSGETSSDSDSAPPTPSGSGGSWDTHAFRRWVRNTFVCRPATQTELERAIDFGLLSPPESSLSGPGVPGHPPSTGLTSSRDLVFHQGRPVALRSRTYRIILRAHWITNHAGRDRTWAVVREVCSYIPKCLVYEFVAACPSCRVARSKQYGIYTGINRGISAVNQRGFQHQGGRDAGGGLPPIFPLLSNDMPPEGWIPRIGPEGPPYPYPTPTSTHPMRDPHRHHEINTQIVTNPISALPLGPVRLPPLQIPSPPFVSIPCQAAGRSQQPDRQGRDLQDAQQETPGSERRYLSWTGILNLIERTARGEQDEDADVLKGSPALMKKDSPSAPEGDVGSVEANVGHETMVMHLFVAPGSLLTRDVRYPVLHGRLIRATKIRAWKYINRRSTPHTIDSHTIPQSRI
jgi:hypothetical protein